MLALALAAELERCGAHDRAFIERWVDGCDAYMAHARAHTPEMVAEVCGVDRAAFDTFADWYCDAKTVGVSVGNGIERGRSGGSGLRAAMALQALTGNHGRLGAGVFAKPGHAFPRATTRLQRPDLVPDGTRTINIVDVSRLLLDDTLEPPIKAVFIYNHNPVATHPDQNRMRRALAREDVFVAGSDVVMTDSMRYCDVVLPASSHFEFADIYAAYGHRHLQRADAVIPRVGESLPNTEIFRRLAARFGFDDPMFRESDGSDRQRAARRRYSDGHRRWCVLQRGVPFRESDGSDRQRAARRRYSDGHRRWCVLQRGVLRCGAGRRDSLRRRNPYGFVRLCAKTALGTRASV